MNLNTLFIRFSKRTVFILNLAEILQSFDILRKICCLKSLPFASTSSSRGAGSERNLKEIYEKLFLSESSKISALIYVHTVPSMVGEFLPYRLIQDYFSKES